MTSAKPNPRRLASLRLHFKKTQERRHQNLDFIMDETDNGKWYIRIRNIDADEYRAGQYIVEMQAPAEYPFKPPKFFFRTPNGLYEINKEICISIGHYHSDNYESGRVKMGGFARELVNGFVNWREMGGGINLLHTSALEKRELSVKSNAFNLKNYADLLRQFNEMDANILYGKLEASGHSVKVRKMMMKFLRLDGPGWWEGDA